MAALPYRRGESARACGAAWEGAPGVWGDSYCALEAMSRDGAHLDRWPAAWLNTSVGNRTSFFASIGWGTHIQPKWLAPLLGHLCWAPLAQRATRKKLRKHPGESTRRKRWLIWDRPAQHHALGCPEKTGEGLPSAKQTSREVRPERKFRGTVLRVAA